MAAIEPKTHVVTYSACQSSVTAAACANGPLLQAVVTFDDYEVGLIVPSQTPVACSETGLCGQALNQNSWQWGPIVPIGQLHRHDTPRRPQARLTGVRP